MTPEEQAVIDRLTERIAELERDDRLNKARIEDMQTVNGSYVEMTNHRITELEALTDKLFKNRGWTPDADDSELLWGVQPSDGYSPYSATTYSCSSEYIARQIVERNPTAKLVRLRVIEVPE